MSFDPVSGTIQGVGAIVQGVASLVGEFVKAGRIAEATKTVKDAIAKYGNEIIPHLKEVVPNDILNNAYDEVDPAGRNMQLEAMKALAGIYNTGGRTVQDEASYQLANMAAGQHSAGQRGAIKQGLQSRGMMSPGLEAAMSMDAAQQDAQNLYMANLQHQANAQREAYNAIAQAGNLAGGMRSQDMQRASAQNDINKWNSSMAWNTQNVNNQNEQWRNQFAQNEQGRLYDQQRDLANAQIGEASSAGNAYNKAGNIAGSAASGAADFYKKYNDWLEEQKKSSAQNADNQGA